MTERLTPEQEAVLVENAFAPGTLVHGLDEELWLGQTLRSGIKPTTFNGLISLSVCTAMLPDVGNPLDSYLFAHHLGPRGEDDNEVSFLLSAESIMKKHPGLLAAVGGRFTARILVDGVEVSGYPRKYCVDESSQTAFGVPIYYDDETHWDDEVRLRCYDETETVTPDMWKGIVIARRSIEFLIEEAKRANYTNDTPVFSTGLKVISPSLAELARKK